VDPGDRDDLWRQFGAALDMLENAMRACPAGLWGDREREPQFWYLAYHTLFWLDYYLSDSPDGFAPPLPCGREEFDPAGVLPPRVYAQDELLAYLEHGRRKARQAIASLGAPGVAPRFRSGWMDFSRLELHLYNLRHVQHGAGQLNLLLRKAGHEAPRWARRARGEGEG